MYNININRNKNSKTYIQKKRLHHKQKHVSQSSIPTPIPDPVVPNTYMWLYGYYLYYYYYLGSKPFSDHKSHYNHKNIPNCDDFTISLNASIKTDSSIDKEKCTNYVNAMVLQCKNKEVKEMRQDLLSSFLKECNN